MPDTELKGKHGRLIPQEHQARVYDPHGNRRIPCGTGRPPFFRRLVARTYSIYRMYLSLLDAQASEHAAPGLGYENGFRKRRRYPSKDLRFAVQQESSASHYKRNP